MTGRSLGKYQLLERLGRGGMAEVYRAVNPDLERQVAIKILHAHLTDAPDFRQRFQREAQAIARLRHPNIIQVFDFDASGDQPYMVMEYIEGCSLKDDLDQRFTRGERLSLEEVLRLFQSVLDAVGYAHAQGMIHRDLKPANVMLEHGGRPILTDFGIARLLDAAKLTASGVTIGTPAYMSPEQGQGQAGDARSDLYSLGVMLYECLAGVLPFEGDSTVALLLKHLSAPVPSLTLVRPELPPAFDQVVQRAMSKDLETRYASAAEMWSDLAAAGGLGQPSPAAAPVPRPTLPASALPGAARPTAPASPKKTPARLWAGLGALALALAAGAWFLSARSAQPSPALATAQAYQTAGSYQLAYDAYSAALEQHPDDTATWLGRAAALEGLGRAPEALEDVEQALRLQPDLAQALAERARLGAQYGLEPDPQRTLADLDQAVKQAPDSARIHFARGWAILNFPLLDDRPNPEAALADLKRAVALDPRLPDAQLTLGQALLADQQAEAALEAANRAVELDPDNALSYVLRAHIQAVLGDFYPASDDLTSAQALPASATAQATWLAEKAYLQFRLNDLAGAQVSLAEALARDPQTQLAQLVSARLNPAQPRPSPADLEAARTAVPNDPIWQAVVADLLASP